MNYVSTCRVIPRCGLIKMGSPIKNCADIKDNKDEENEEPGSPTVRDEEKLSNTENNILIIFHAVSNAPVLKRRKWTVPPDKKMGAINIFLKRLIKCNSAESLFLYVNQAFAPAPDETVQNLYDCFGVEGALNIHYCKTQAWG